MSQPAVNLTELDGALGILPESAGRLFAVMGVSSIGTADTPAAFARITDLQTNFGEGPAVEAAAYYIEKYGRPVVFVKTGATNVGTFEDGATTQQPGTGTSVATVDTPATAPQDDYDFYVLVTNGGTVGSAGITLQWSLDGGRTLSPATALGVALSFVIPESGGVTIDFAAGTLVTGDTITFRGLAPKWDTTEIGTALDALFASTQSWEICHVVGDIESADFDTIDPKFTGGFNSGKFRSWYGNTRMPLSPLGVPETEAAYKIALDAIFDSKATVHGGICAGSAQTISSVSGRQYRRPISYAVAAFEQSVSEEINIASVRLGVVPGVSIKDANGNPDLKYHDESLNPGLDDSRFTVLRTWNEVQGVYVNRPRVLSAAGSDFDIYPKRRVLNIAHATLLSYFIRRLNEPILVDRNTGYILESEALEIETGARAAMRSTLLAKPKASAVEFTLSRTDNILSTKTLTGSGRVIPLAYPEFIDLEVGFTNPALSIVSV